MSTQSRTDSCERNTTIGIQFARRTPVLLAGALAFAAAACGDSTTGPGGQTASLFSDEISLETFEETVNAEPQRVEIELLPGTLTAREVEIEEPEERFDREEIESRVVAIDPGAGTLTLQLGDLIIDFDQTTEFRRDSGDDLDFDTFVARIEEALAAGRKPPVEAKRPAPAEPQAPDDPTFFATRLELDNESDEPEIEINIDGDNLILNDTPPPDAILRVLGLSIEIRASEGITELEEEADREDQEVEFEGLVESVDVGAGTVLLTDGSVIVIVDETELEGDDGDDDGEDDEDELGSLDEVAAALEQGLPVEADGEGVVESVDPRTIVAKEIEFEIEDDDDDDDDHDDDDDDDDSD